MSGRRAYPRFREMGPWGGQMRISRDVAVQIAEDSGEFAVLSDAPGIVDEQLTLALVSSGGEMELKVKVVDSKPHVVDGVLRHRLRLQLMAADGLGR